MIPFSLPPAIDVLDEGDDETFECVVPPLRGLSRDEAQFIELWVDSQDAIGSARKVWGGSIDGKRALSHLLARPAGRLYAHDLRAFYYRRIFNTKEDIIVEIEAMLADSRCKGKVRVRLLELAAKLIVPKLSISMQETRGTDEQGKPTRTRGLTMTQIMRFRTDMLGMDRSIAEKTDLTVGASRTGRNVPIDTTFIERETRDGSVERMSTVRDDGTDDEGGEE